MGWLTPVTVIAVIRNFFEADDSSDMTVADLQVHLAYGVEVPPINFDPSLAQQHAIAGIASQSSVGNLDISSYEIIKALLSRQ